MFTLCYIAATVAIGTVIIDEQGFVACQAELNKRSHEAASILSPFPIFFYLSISASSTIFGNA